VDQHRNDWIAPPLPFGEAHRSTPADLGGGAGADLHQCARALRHDRRSRGFDSRKIEGRLRVVFTIPQQGDRVRTMPNPCIVKYFGDTPFRCLRQSSITSRNARVVRRNDAFWPKARLHRS